MKSQYLLLFALLSIFVIQVQANGDYGDYEQWEHDFPDTCEELFKTKNCNKCQSLMWDHFKEPGQCATAFNLGHEIFKAIKDSGEEPKPYNLKFFKKGLRNYCHKGFHCSQQKVEKIYYTGIPARKALCTKRDGDFCSIEFVEKLSKWIKKKTNADPKAIVTHDLKFVIKGDGNKIRIPRSFFCDPCWRKMAHIYVDYIKEHRLKKSVEKNIWGSYRHLEELYLPHCTYHKRGLGEILKERSVSQLNERSTNPAFGILSHHMSKLHSLAI